MAPDNGASQTKRRKDGGTVTQPEGKTPSPRVLLDSLLSSLGESRQCEEGRLAMILQAKEPGGVPSLYVPICDGHINFS